jgi:hypothetical protein
MVLNRAYLKVFNKVAMNPEYAPHFKLMAQIHDSIFYQYRRGHDYFHPMIKKMMEIPVTVKAYDGVVRTFVVPSSVKAGTCDIGTSMEMSIIKYQLEQCEEETNEPCVIIAVPEPALDAIWELHKKYELMVELEARG